MKSWVWLDGRDAHAVHERSLLLHGGAAGLRDEGLLQSALARPLQLAAYGENVEVFDLAAAYTGGIVKNHPLVGILFLELNGAQFTASEAAATQSVLGLAAGTLDDAGYAIFLRENVIGG
jgi:death-on-curing protein